MSTPYRGVIIAARVTGLRLAAAACAGVLCCVPAGAQSRLFEQEPYDLITLNKTNGGTVLKIRPLPQRQLPEDPPSRSKLRVRLVDSPDTAYDILWSAIDREKCRLFEELVLDEANKLVAEANKLMAAGKSDAGKLKFDEAYDYFKFLEETAHKPSGLRTAIEDYLYWEAVALHRQGKYDVALARLRELYRRNPRRPRLENALGMETDELIKQYRQGKDYPSARKLLAGLAAWYPRHPIVVKHQTELSRQAEEMLAEARRLTEAGKHGEATRLRHELVRVWPEVPGAEQFASELHRKYPRVVVGVCDAAVDPLPGRLGGWPARRSGRLLYRTLAEFTGVGTQGGVYLCPVGNLSIDELEGRLSLEIRPNVRWSSGNAALTGFDVSRRLLAMTEPGDAAYRVDWAELLSGVSVSGVYNLEVELHRPHVRPDALLQAMLVPYSASAGWGDSPLPNGPYVENLRTDETVIYRRNLKYFAPGPKPPEEIVETHFPLGAKAIEALRDGRIHVLDRVDPWSLNVGPGGVGLKGVRPIEKLAVGQYALPLVHCLIPNVQKPLLARRTFRRALLYAIHRRAILEHLTAGAELRGCELISGPFPRGLSSNDKLNYAYNYEIPPRGYDPRLAVALATVALRGLTEEKDPQAKPLEKLPPLVLAHPSNEIATVACQSIKRQLGLINIPVTLRPFAGAAPKQIPPEVDLLYAELAIWEPVVDARRLLGEDGMSGGCSPYMSLALRQLEAASDWQSVGRILRHTIHRIAHDDVAVLPLWQLTDHFAYHEDLSGIGTRPISLYQNVEDWQLSFRYSVEQ